MKLYLARHGESEGNAMKVLYGRTDYPLTGQGVADARLLGEKLAGEKIDRCLASPLIRAAETARLALDGRNVPIEFTEDLLEQDMGEYEGKPFLEMLENDPERINAMLDDWTQVVPPGGESFPHIMERVRRCIDGVVAAGEDTLIVAHNGPLSAMLTSLLRIPPSGTGYFWLEHGCWSCVDITDGRVRLVCFNR